MEVETLSLDNILEAEDIDNLFLDDEEKQETPPKEKDKEETPPKGNPEEKKEKEETTEVDVDDLFTEPESVGSGKDDNEEKEDTDPKGNGTSPNNFYSSIAKALKDEGIFPDLDSDIVDKVKEAEDFRDLIEQQINAGLNERQKRINDALNAGVETDDIKKYEGTISYLNSIDEKAISDEGDAGEELRRRLITQDLMNRGYKKERIEREVEKSFNSGSDVEDAKEALESNKTFFQDKYDDLIKEAKEAAAQEEKDRKAQAEKLKTSILEDKNVFGDLSVDKSTRQKIYDNITKPVYKDPDTGEFYTAIQKYEMDNRTEFLKNVSLVFTLTDGFKNLDGLVKGKVKKEVKKGLRELENTLNNTARTSDGNLKFASGTQEDPESFISKGWSLDV